MQLTVDACIAAVEDAGPTLADIDGLTTYPAASQARPSFSGASLRDIHDAGVKPNWVAGGVESPGQLGAVVDAMLAVAGGVADHVLCWRSIYEGTAQRVWRKWRSTNRNDGLAIAVWRYRGQPRRHADSRPLDSLRAYRAAFII